jgi:hypothetical protein
MMKFPISPVMMLQISAPVGLLGLNGIAKKPKLPSMYCGDHRNKDHKIGLRQHPRTPDGNAGPGEQQGEVADRSEQPARTRLGTDDLPNLFDDQACNQRDKQAR